VGSNPTGPTVDWSSTKEETMNWIVMLIMSIVMPVVQPMVQNGVQQVQTRVQARIQQQAQQPQPYITYHEGRWWKLENNQWYVWTEQR
jgi:hypothetical protein